MNRCKQKKIAFWWYRTFKKHRELSCKIIKKSMRTQKRTRFFEKWADDGFFGIFCHIGIFYNICEHMSTLSSLMKKKQSVSLPGGWITCRLLKFGIMDANVWKLTFLFILKILNDEQSYVSHSTYVSPGEVLLYFF